MVASPSSPGDQASPLYLHLAFVDDVSFTIEA